MQPNFIEVGSTVINLNHIACIHFSGDVARVEMPNGNCHCFFGSEAADLRRYFRPLEPPQKEGP